MSVAALLLTGGTGRRMGRDKATLGGCDGRPLAARTAALLAEVADPVIEVGPGRSGAPAVMDSRVGAGPLAAVATGVGALVARGWHGAALVVATDLPDLHVGPLAWLADHAAAGSVIPIVGGRPQLLCARYDAATLEGAFGLVAAGARRMADLVAGRGAHLAGPEEWSEVTAAHAWHDVDTPDDLRAAQDRWRRAIAERAGS